jgi:hypothetical protein
MNELQNTGGVTNRDSISPAVMRMKKTRESHFATTSQKTRRCDP